MKKYILILFCISFSICFGQSNEKAVEVIQRQAFFLNAAQNVLGNSRQVIPITLPPKTVKWYYTISAFRNEKDVKTVASTFDLLSNISKALDVTSVSTITLKMLGTPPGSDYCDAYLLSSANDIKHFESKDDNWGGSFNYLREGTRENITSGVIDIKDSRSLSGTQYLGFRNRAFFGVNVSLQVIAIVQEDIKINGWTKDQKNTLFSSLKNELNSKGFKGRYTDLQVDNLVGCMLSKLTSSYNPAQLQAYANYELNNIINDIGLQCGKELGLHLDEIKVAQASKEELVGRWKDENSTFTLFATGFLTIKWDNGISKLGNWDLVNGTLTMKFNGETKTYQNVILEFSKDKLIYRETGSDTTYNAIKIGQF